MNAPLQPRVPALERLLSKVVRLDDEEGGCWQWIGTRTPDGYARFYIGRDTARGESLWKRAHRISYEIFVGPIPEGLQIDHLCRNKLCVNPEHLDVVTNRENTLRGLRGRLVTHCPQGHEYTPENTAMSSQGRRHCITCRRAHQRAHRARNRDTINAQRRARTAHKRFLQRINQTPQRDV